MLAHLEIRDFAIIDYINVEFAPGLNVFTGETGAGKSILIDAIEFLIGGRANQTIIKQEAKKTQVQAEFNVKNIPQVISYLEDNSFILDSDSLIISREFHTSGRSVSRINGTVVPLTIVKEVTEHIIDLHGQHEHQTLLKPAAHLDLLDASDTELTKLRQGVLDKVLRQKKLQKILEELSGNGFKKELDFLQFQLTELKNAKLQQGEDEELKKERSRLEHLEQLAQNASILESSLAGDDSPGVISSLAESIKYATEISRYETKMQGWKERLGDIVIELEELRQLTSRIKDEAVPDPLELERVLERLDEIERLKRKYGGTIEEILEEQEKITVKIDELINREEKITTFKREIEVINQEIAAICQELSQKRKLKAQGISELVNKELPHLSIGLLFRINVTPTERVTERGNDQVEFQVTHSGQDANDNAWLPLVKIASGGELSRLMLALKVVLAKADKLPVLVYDEIDTGIGGEAAFAVADRLASLGNTHQVLCVTHLHQIAAYATHHLLVEKEALNGSINTKITALDESRRIQEIARMLGGEEKTEAVLGHAKELLSKKYNHTF